MTENKGLQTTNIEETEVDEIVTKVKNILCDIKQSRDDVDVLYDRVDGISSLLEEKIINYLTNAKNINSFSLTAELVDSMTSIFKLMSDMKTQKIKSLEKEVELTSKYTGDDGRRTGDETAFTFNNIAQLITQYKQQTEKVIDADSCFENDDAIGK